MLPPSMAVPNTTARKLGCFIFFACAAALAVAFWYVRPSGWWEGEQDIADDDEEPAMVKPDAGAHRRRSKKAATPKKKVSDTRQARSGAAHPGEGPVPAGPSGMSYEAAIAGNNLQLAPGTTNAPDLTDAELGGPMRDGTFLDACDVPSSTHVTVKVAIQNGRAVGISVYAVPPSREIAGCIERHVRGFQWSSNAKMDSFVTTY